MKSSQGQHYSAYDKKENIYETCGEHGIVGSGASVLEGGVKIQNSPAWESWFKPRDIVLMGPGSLLHLDQAWKLQAW